ncbi:hypothetical protein E2C01_009205 [Portunus trituberculatus]|uniref:Uncharacterized protein n=1 Tax=Portunus trituberculatus TaxID=210409 RepID=A0A5B7D4N7_PORTR|nr:hypothetical protein [Portunus trituberculatus]
MIFEQARKGKARTGGGGLCCNQTSSSLRNQLPTISYISYSFASPRSRYFSLLCGDLTGLTNGHLLSHPRCIHSLLDTLLGWGVDGAAQALAAILPDTEKLPFHLRHLEGKGKAEY